MGRVSKTMWPNAWISNSRYDPCRVDIVINGVCGRQLISHHYTHIEPLKLACQTNIESVFAGSQLECVECLSTMVESTYGYLHKKDKAKC